MQVGKEEAISSFYCSEFPERCRAEDLFKLFGCVGEVVEVVIPPRRNRFGKRFGFARFKRVEDENLLAVKLDNILIDGKKMHVNLPRFNRKEGKGRLEAARQHKKDTQETFFPGHNFEARNKSFAEAVLKGKKVEDKEIVTGFSFKSCAEVKDRWRKAFIGEVLFAGETYNIQTHLEIEGFFLIKVHPLGANLCLLEEVEEGVIQELINEASSWWKQWFKLIRPWQESDIDAERVMWIRVHGIPCHAWCFEFFESIAKLLGSYVCVDENTMPGSNMDIARILIRVPSSFILKETMVVDIDGEIYSLALREDTYGPVRLMRKIISSKKLSSSTSSSGESGSNFDENHIEVIDSGSSCGDPDPLGEEWSQGMEERRQAMVAGEYGQGMGMEENQDKVSCKEKVTEGGKDLAAFDAALMEAWQATSCAHEIEKATLDPISKLTFSSSKVSETLDYYNGATHGTTHLPEEGFVPSTRKCKRKTRKRFKKLAFFGGPSNRLHHRPKYSKKRSRQPINNLLVGPSEINGPLLKITLSPPPQVTAISSDNVQSSVSGDKPTDSDILRCNERIWSNFGISPDGKMRSMIASLGVVMPEVKRDLEKNTEVVKIVA